jgi:hypothetical protein
MVDEYDSRRKLGCNHGASKVLHGKSGESSGCSPHRLRPTQSIARGAPQARRGERARAACAERPITVFRDLNKDFSSAGDRTDTGVFGINQHWVFDVSAGDIGKASAGCLVGRTRSSNRQFVSLVKSDPRFVAGRGYLFTTAVLDSCIL